MARFGLVWPFLATFGPVRPCLDPFDPVCHSSIFISRYFKVPIRQGVSFQMICSWSVSLAIKGPQKLRQLQGITWKMKMTWNFILALTHRLQHRTACNVAHPSKSKKATREVQNGRQRSWKGSNFRLLDALNNFVKLRLWFKELFFEKICDREKNGKWKKMKIMMKKAVHYCWCKLTP